MTTQQEQQEQHQEQQDTRGTGDGAPVVIAGAGIGGLTAALALHARGVRATVLESTRELKPLGVGINLQPAAVEALDALGLRETLESFAIPTSEARYVTRSGVELATRPFTEDEQQISVHRGQLQMMLYDAVVERLGEDAVTTGRHVDGFEQDDDTLTVRVTRRDDDQSEELAAHALLAADGVHSAIREQIHPDRSFQWEGTTMYRGTTESDPFLDGRTMVLVYGEQAKRFLAYPISREHEEKGRSLVNWVAMVPESEARTLGPDDIANEPVTPDDVRPLFEGWALDYLDMEELVEGGTDVLKYPMTDREPLDSWGEGRVTLLGDAAHPMYPIGANGGSQAILDAVAFAEHYAPVASGSADEVSAALREYEQERRPATNDVVEANRRLNETEREIAGRSQDELEEMARSGEFEEIQKKYAQGKFDEI